MANNLKWQSKELAVKYFTVAVILFGAQLLMGLIAATQFLYPSFLFEIFDFSVVPFSGVSGVKPLTQPQKGHFRAKREKSPLCVLAYNLKIA